MTDEAREGWLQHPYTRKSAKGFDKQSEAALDALLRVCAASTDVKVTRSHAAYVALKANAMLFGEGAPSE